jgi:hypothetical protein
MSLLFATVRLTDYCAGIEKARDQLNLLAILSVLLSSLVLI